MPRTAARTGSRVSGPAHAWYARRKWSSSTTKTCHLAVGSRLGGPTSKGALKVKVPRAHGPHAAQSPAHTQQPPLQSFTRVGLGLYILLRASGSSGRRWPKSWFWRVRLGWRCRARPQTQRWRTPRRAQPSRTVPRGCAEFQPPHTHGTHAESQTVPSSKSPNFAVLAPIGAWRHRRCRGAKGRTP